MSNTHYVFQAEDYYKEFREKGMEFGVPYPWVNMEGVRIYKVDFSSPNWGCLLLEDQKVRGNTDFPYILFLPKEAKGFGKVIVILNGLNESEYRKFFPWACSFARGGVPTILFPIAFLINRRPRDWFSRKSLERTLKERQGIERNDTCTPFNAVLSSRLSRSPERLFLAGLQTYRDLINLAHAVYRGNYRVTYRDGNDTYTFNPFTENTNLHFLGYSIGGYLALILMMLKKDDIPFFQSRCIVFCAGAPINSDDPSSNGNPLSPLILDKSATSKLFDFYINGREFPYMDSEEGRLFRGLFLSEKEVIYPKLDELYRNRRIKIIVDENDSVVPPEGIENNLGKVDLSLNLGVHEYPFNIHSLKQKNLEREIVKSYNLAEGFREEFKRFIDSVLDFV